MNMPSYRRIRVAEIEDVGRLYPLIEAYVANPLFASSVKEFAIRGTDLPGQGWSDDYGPFPKDDKSQIEHDTYTAIQSHIASLGLEPDSTKHMEKCFNLRQEGRTFSQYGSREGVGLYQWALTATVLLLSLCKDIEKLYVDLPPGESVLREYLLKSNYGKLPMPGLQRVKDVEIIRPNGCSSDEREYHRLEFMENIQYFHRLPNITSLSMEGMQDYQLERHFFVPGCGNFKAMTIGHSDVDIYMLCTLIKIPKSLEQLTISLGGLESTDGGEPQYSASKVGEALQRYRSTLQKLDLDVGYSGGDVDEDCNNTSDEMSHAGTYGDDYLSMDKAITHLSTMTDDTFERPAHDGSIGSLREFRALTDLSIGVSSALGSMGLETEDDLEFENTSSWLVEMLPPNLERFCLYGYVSGQNPRLDRHVEDFNERRAELLPKLKEIRGLESNVPHLTSLYGEFRDVDGDEDDDDGDDDEHVWKIPEETYDWVEI